MTHTPAKALRRGLPAALALVAVCGAPAQASDRDTTGVDWLYLTVTQGETPAADSRGTLLQCDPPDHRPTGHPRAADVCAELDAAGGDIDGLPVRDEYCPMVYAPVTAHADGQWRGKPVTYTRTFPNACVMAARTGAVFAFPTAP
ncbi:SSI family serine proteinase inhibitor [Streptomyces sp. NPDC052682]|uniref:SSI family serine proteinase inhibitor n=1 Tax=Streptomyces sp. NPDC052682 TaxID=3154954 RepID=UPI00344742CB